MLSTKKRMLALVAGSTMTLAAAVPALAMENEFHGMLRTAAVSSNYTGSESASYFSYNGSNFFAQDTTKTNFKDPHQNNAMFLDQRARLMYIAKIDDDLKLVTHFELNSRWGDSAYVAGISGGGAIGADAVNLRTKNVYLDYSFNAGIPWNARVGIQSFGDNYKGVFFNNDAAAAILTAKLDSGSVRLGFSRFADNSQTNYSLTTNNTGGANPTPNTNGNVFGPGSGTNNVNTTSLGVNGQAQGDATVDWYFVDGKYQINKALTVGGSYYLFYSDIAKKLFGNLPASKNVERMHMVGVNAEGKVGGGVVNGFVLYQFGKDATRTVSAFTANLGARIPVGPGTLRSELMYMSGDNGNTSRNTGFYSVGGECGYMDTGMQLLARDNVLIMTRNNALFMDNNAGQGAGIFTVGYDLPLSKKLMLVSNVGTAKVAARNQHIVASSGSHLGTEINFSLPFQAKDNLTLSPRIAYVFLGNFFDHQAAGGKNPDDLYMASLIASLKF